MGGDIALGAVLLVLLPGSFLLGFYLLLRHWLQRPVLHTRRAVFVLRWDPAKRRAASHVAEAVGNKVAVTKLRGGSTGRLAGLLRTIGCAQQHPGTWISINLDSRCAHGRVGRRAGGRGGGGCVGAQQVGRVKGGCSEG